MSYTHEEILDEIQQFRNDNPDDDEFFDTIAQFVLQVQDEARPVYVQRDKEQGQATGMALGIHIYKLLQEKEKFAYAIDQLAYSLATELDFHYEFYYKRGK